MQVTDLGNSGTLINSGTLNTEFGLGNSGTLINSGTLNSSVDTENSGRLINAGTIVNLYYFDNSGRLINSGTFNNASGASLTDAGTIKNTGTFTNAGTVEIPHSRLFTTSSNYTQTAGSTDVNGTLMAAGGAQVNIEGGTLSGRGLITGNLTNAGTLAPGDPVGTLSVRGNYTQTGAGSLGEMIDGGAPGEFGVTQITGLADLDGTLNLDFASGFTPFLNETFTIMTFGSLDGRFSTVNGLSFDGFMFDLNYNTRNITLVAASDPPHSTLFAAGSDPVATPEPPASLPLLVGLSGLFTVICLNKGLRNAFK